MTSSTLLEMYISSNLTCIHLFQVCAQYVKAFSVAFAYCQVSLMSHSCQTSLRAAIANSLSNLGGIQSVASSVTLKSPRVKSSISKCLACLSVMTYAQKLVCSLLSLGTYIFSIVAEQVFSHFTFSIATLPGISMCISISSGLINCLLMMKPTPADAQGMSG